MRTVTNTLMFLVALLTIVGIYLFREQSVGSLHSTFGALLGNQKPVKHEPPAPHKVEAGKQRRQRNLREPQAQPEIEIKVTATPVEPKPTTGMIRIGMAKTALWGDFGRPVAITSSRDGERFLETFIYLLDDPAKATVVRLVNGTVVSVADTRTISPPLLVPRSNGLQTPVSLQPRVM
jgi:hypothetical protein